VDFPVDVALAELVPTLPVGAGWRYEMKFDGHRTVVWREKDTVWLQARSGRDVTAVWMDLALAAFEMLPPGVVLDGEAVIYAQGKIDFAAAQSRALSAPARARRLAPPRARRRASTAVRRPACSARRPAAGVRRPAAAPAGANDRRPHGGPDLVPTTPGAGHRGHRRQAGHLCLQGGPDLEEDQACRDCGCRRRGLHRASGAAAGARGLPPRRAYRAQPGPEGAARSPGRGALRGQRAVPNRTDHSGGGLRNDCSRAGG
jgi:hypothetical protein